MQVSTIRQILLMTLLLTAWCAGPAHADLVAPVYPGAVPAPLEVSEQMQPYEQVFFSRDAIDQVVAFYRTRLGEMAPWRHPQAQRGYHYITGKGPIREKASLIPYELGVFVSAPRLKEGHDQPQPAQPGAPGVTPEIAGADQRCFFNDFFQPLRNMVGLLEHRDWQQFNAICQRYHHLTWSMFAMTEERDQRGRPMRMDQVLVRDYRPSGQPPASEVADADPEKMGARMQALMMAGRRDEARALAEQMAAQAKRQNHGPGMRLEGGKVADDWDDWLALLEQIDQHAYRTRILIHRDPSTWPRR
jgi:hypothetical protein